MKICAVVGCSNSTRTIHKWKKGGCNGERPFNFHKFPTNPTVRAQWVKLINRKDKITGKPWQPTKQSFVCSVHFCSGKRNGSEDLPTEKLGYTYKRPIGAAQRHERMQKRAACKSEHSYSKNPTGKKAESDIDGITPEVPAAPVSDVMTCDVCIDVSLSTATHDHVSYVGSNNNKCLSCCSLTEQVSTLSHCNTQLLSELDSCYRSMQRK